MPLLKRGIPAEPMQLENVTIAGALKDQKILVMTYEGMKPMTADVHPALAAWVKDGGVLVFVGDDRDPYNGVRSWWNDKAKGMSYKAPREHLFEQLGLARDAAPGTYPVGKGKLIYDASSPAALTYKADGADRLVALTREATKAAGVAYRETNYLALRRGPYVVAAGLDESVAGDPQTLRGRFVDLFDAGLPIVDAVSLAPGSRRLLLDLDRALARTPAPAVLASACKVLGAEKTADGGFKFFAEGPEKTEAVVRLALAGEPKEVTVDGKALEAASRTWDAGSNTVLLRFPNAPAGRRGLNLK